MATQRNQSDNSNPGFGSMDKDKQREMASKGGQESRSGADSKDKDRGSKSSSRSSSTRGGSPEQHAKAGRQSHKNS